MRFRVGFAIAAIAVFCSSSAIADDIGAAARGVVRVIVAVDDGDGGSIGFGSGFAVSPHHVVTNAHVVEAARNPFADSILAVVPSEGSKPFGGRIIAYDPERDLALLEVKGTRLEPLAVYSGPIDPGSDAAALGYPGNVDLATAGSLSDLIEPIAPVRSKGNISSERSVDGTPALLHTAAISHGNSGGPLVDECGRVLGVNTYTTRSGSGDAPFGFAIVSRELMSFLRDQGEEFQQVGVRCVTAAEQAQREQLARDRATRNETVAQQRAAQEQENRLQSEKAELQQSRENHIAASALLVILSIIAGAFATALFIKDRLKAAAASAAFAALALVGGTYSFFSRPGLKVDLPRLTSSAAAATAPLDGKLLCQVRPELSRVTVSSTNDLAMTWDSRGCMNGRTQYVEDDDHWRRVLVPNGSQTVALQDFDPTKGEYVSIRFFLPQVDMERLRAIRSRDVPSSCTSDVEPLERLRRVTEELANSLPSEPNEKLVYKCASN